MSLGLTSNPSVAASLGCVRRNALTAVGQTVLSTECFSARQCFPIGFTLLISRTGFSTAIERSFPMLNTTDIDVIVGGAGVAGTAAAAAIQKLGYGVLLVEPGLNDERRLAGEVFHPPGVS